MPWPHTKAEDRRQKTEDRIQNTECSHRDSYLGHRLRRMQSWGLLTENNFQFWLLNSQFFLTLTPSLKKPKNKLLIEMEKSWLQSTCIRVTSFVVCDNRQGVWAQSLRSNSVPGTIHNNSSSVRNTKKILCNRCRMIQKLHQHLPYLYYISNPAVK